MQMKMKKGLSAAAALLLAASAMPVSGVSAETAEPPGVFPEAVTFVEPLYDDYDPAGNDYIAVFGPLWNKYQVDIIQHSPERENLLLFSNRFYQEENEPYFYRMEPGEYTIRISSALVLASPVLSTAEIDFTIENSDYSGGAYDRSAVGFFCDLEMAEKNEDVSPQITLGEQEVKATALTSVNRITFKRYTLFRGDFDGDGTVEAEDAQHVLMEYVAGLVGKTTSNSATAEQTAACDINGDGKLGADDAQFILQFYVNQMTGKEPSFDKIAGTESLG